MTSKDTVLGKITAPHGIKGEVKIISYTEDPFAIGDYTPLFDKQGNIYVVESLKPTGKEALIARIKGIDTRNQSEALRGTTLLTSSENIARPEEEDSFLISDLVGMRVLLSDGTEHGTVASVQNFGAGELLEIQNTSSQKTEFYRFSKEQFPSIDLEQQCLTFHPPEILDATRKA